MVTLERYKKAYGLLKHVVFDLVRPTNFISAIGNLLRVRFSFLTSFKNSLETFHILFLHPDCYGIYVGFKFLKFAIK